MKINAVRLHNVKRFAGRGVAIEGIGDGVNVLCAVNEFGKSTSFEALHALFFQPHSSTSADVRSLRPYSGGNPMVEADITTEKGRFRITKQYYGGRAARVAEIGSGRLVAQADEAENFITDLIKGGTAGPAGLLWVRQGMTGIERRSKSEEDGEKQVRASLLESVQGEVEAVTGGRRMAEIMAATEDALARLVTPTGRAKAGERYADAVEELGRLEAEERRLSDEVAALRNALDERAKASKRLAELDRAEDREARRTEVETAQAAFDAAKSQAESLRAAQAELNLVREQRETAQKELGSFRSALEKARTLHDRLAIAERKRAEAATRRQDAASAIATARTGADAAETREQEARSLLARLDAAMRSREAAERLAELETQLTNAEAARKAIEEGEAELALLTLPEKAIEELAGVEMESARHRARDEAARPSIAIRYEAGAPASIAMDGVPLQDGEQRAYAGQAELSVAGIGQITLRSDYAERDGKPLKQAEDRRREILASMGVETLAAARMRQVEAQRRESAVREERVRLSMLAPDGLVKLREAVAQRRSTLAEHMELKEDPEQVRAALADAETHRATLRQSLRELEPARTSADEAFLAQEAAVATLAAERAQVEAIVGPEETRLDRERERAERLDALDAQHGRAEATVAALRATAVDLASAEATLRRVRSASDAAEKEIATLRESVAGLTAEIRARSDEAVEEKWRETGEALAAVKTRVAAFEREIALLQRLRSALEFARAEARDHYLRPVMTELQPLLGLLFEEASITFDEKTLLPHKILRNGQEEEVERLSGGMREQLSVLTRLAFARLLARDGRPAPVILDDALVYSDDDRIEKMFDALHRQARDQQIIVFSCRQRAFQKLGGNVLTMVEWQP
jgi:DNA repair exonuclease SbcCD ATPase subunit